MKTIRITFTCIALFFVGCIRVPSPYSEQLKPIADHYSSVKNGASRMEVEAQVGKPSREEEAGVSVWETRFDELNYTMLKVWFDRQNKAEKVEVTRAHGKIAPGYRSSAVSTVTTER